MQLRIFIPRIITTTAMSLFDLTGKTALITGATRGIGQAIALALSDAGADLVFIQVPLPPIPRLISANSSQRNLDNLETRDAVKSRTGKETPIVLADLSSDDLAEVVTSILAAQRIDILVNCAGIQSRSPAASFPLPAWNTVLQTNLTAVFTLCKTVGAHWLANKQRGRIINLASLLSFQGGLTVPAYAASKAGVLALTKSLSNEWAGHGIGVNSVAPGYIATDMNEALLADEGRNAQIMARIPAGRWGKPEDFAGVAVWLASERASGYVSGECVVVDGGWMGR